MNDAHPNDRTKELLSEFPDIAEPRIREVVDKRKEQRSKRRAAAINAVADARFHAGRHEEAYTQSDADVIMAIMELLDRVAEQ